MHNNNIKDDTSDVPDELLKQFDLLLEDYINCTMDYPVYYKNTLLKEELEDLENERLEKEAEKERIRKDREEHTRKFGNSCLYPMFVLICSLKKFKVN